MLVGLERERFDYQADGSGEGEAHGRKRMRIDAFCAESDLLIGKSGEDFFKHCFAEKVREIIDFEATTLARTDHHSVAGYWIGGFERILTAAKESLS